jgi:hypothetical protein
VVSAILILGSLFKLIGLLLAVPLVAALSVLVRELWIARMDRIGTVPCAPTPEQEKPMPARVGSLRRVSNKLQRPGEP